MLIRPPDQPDNRASYYSCGYCPVVSQIVRRVEDETGEPILAPNADGELVEQIYCDEQQASDDLGAHVAAEHPQVLE